MRRHDRNAGLDLLRFLAVSGVVVAHCAVVFGRLLGWTPPNLLVMAAFFGVELFFVLSGFLIGGLLLDIVAVAATPRAFAVFMTRRWLRTLPLYYLWLAVLPLLLPTTTRIAPFATLTQNLAWPMPPGGFFSVSWSLAIEEWFYLLFGACLLGAVFLARARWPVWPVIAAFLVVPAVARLLRGAPADYSTAVYQVVLYRLDAIAWGVALAKLHRQGSALFARPVLALGLGLPLVGLVWAETGTNFLPIGRPAFIATHLFATSLGLSLCLAGAVALERAPWRLFAPVRFGARISYGVYLTHLTIIEVVLARGAGHGWPPVMIMAATLPLMLLLPWASYRWFEAPILARRPAQFAAAAAGVQPAAIAGIQDRSARSRAS
jgi:peptidoglycan/LPS O-acetylase OafA/YrhL